MRMEFSSPISRHGTYESGETMLRVNEFKNGDLQVKGSTKGARITPVLAKCKNCEAVLGEKPQEKRKYCDYICKRIYLSDHPNKVIKKSIKQKKDWFYKKWD